MRRFSVRFLAFVVVPACIVGGFLGATARISDMACGESIRNLRIPYAYAAAYVIVTESTEKSTEKTSVETSGNHLPGTTKMVEATDGDNEYVPIDSLSYEDLLSSDEIIRIYGENEAEISKIWASLDGQEFCRMKDAVMIWLVTKAVKNPAAGDSKTSYPPVNKQSAAAEGESTPAVSKGSPPPAAASTRPLFYEIILHTGENCKPCDEIKHELKVRGYSFTEHFVTEGNFPIAFIDGKEFVGKNAICNRLKIVQLNRKDSP